MTAPISAAQLYGPLIALGTRIGRFQAPFEYLRESTAGFSPDVRYVLTKCFAGDDAAERARAAHIAFVAHVRLKTEYPRECWSCWEEYLNNERVAFREFSRKYYGCLFPPSEDPDPRWFEPDPEIDAKIDQAVFRWMGEFGFTKRRRRCNGSRWLCTTREWGTEAVLCFEKGGSRSTRMSGYWRFPEAVAQVTLGDPFCFSAATFSYPIALDVAVQLEAYFAQLSRIMPHFISALREGL